MSKNTGRVILFPVPLSETAPADVMPAGNIGLLRGVRYFVVENTRSARRFLRSAISDFDIDACTFTELNEHTHAADVVAMLEPAIHGPDIGVISEAGCPAVADPGSDLVAAAHRVGVEVLPLIGPSSLLLGLMGSGFNGQEFAFLGYLPVDADARRTRLRQIEREVRTTGRTSIFIEAPYRNNRMIADIVRSLSSHTLLCVASDVTGPKQNIRTMNVGRWAKAEYDYDRVPTIFLLGRGQ